MYEFEQQIRVMLEFPAMPAPVEISVPWNVLRYLDIHADREFAPDGMVVYRRRVNLAAPARLACSTSERALVLA